MKQSVSGYIFYQILTSVDGGDDGCCVVLSPPKAHLHLYLQIKEGQGLELSAMQHNFCGVALFFFNSVWLLAIRKCYHIRH